MTTQNKAAGRPGPIRVGAVLFPVHLLGIHNYMVNLFAAMQSLPGSPLEPVVFTGERYGDVAKEFIGVPRVRASLLDRGSAAWWVRKAVQQLTGRDLLLERLLHKHGVQVLTHSAALGKGARIKTVGWIADLQHMRLPELFSAEERGNRDRSFSRLCKDCDTLVVSSACGLEDLRTFSPANVSKGRVLHFVSAATPEESATRLPELQERYALTGAYVLLPNQFWPHKNHRLVVNAVRLLRDRGTPVVVVCTGSTKGPQDTGYFPGLMEQVKAAGIADLFRVLGVIPFADLSGLMLHAAALVNPSLFEGWSTSVEESKSVGKTMLLSDIPVHREQNPELGVFFAPDDAPALADAMAAAVAQHDAQRDLQRRRQADRAFAGRLQQFGEAYHRIIVDTVSR